MSLNLSSITAGQVKSHNLVCPLGTGSTVNLFPSGQDMLVLKPREERQEEGRVRQWRVKPRKI